MINDVVAVKGNQDGLNERLVSGDQLTMVDDGLGRSGLG